MNVSQAYVSKVEAQVRVSDKVREKVSAGLVALGKTIAPVSPSTAAQGLNDHQFVARVERLRQIAHLRRR